MIGILLTLLMVTWLYDGQPPWDEVYHTQPVYLDKEGKHMVNLQIVDKICSHKCVSGLYETYGEGTISIVDGHFGWTPGAMHFNDMHGCTTFMHERYHAIHGDYNHETMPVGCEGVW